MKTQPSPQHNIPPRMRKTEAPSSSCQDPNGKLILFYYNGSKSFELTHGHVVEIYRARGSQPWWHGTSSLVFPGKKVQSTVRTERRKEAGRD